MKGIVLAMALSVTTFALTRDHLVPDHSIYAAAHPSASDINPKLLPLFEPRYTVRLVADVALRGSHGVGLSQDRGRTTMRYIGVSPIRHPDIDCEAPLDAAFAADLFAAWRKVLATVRDGDGPSFGLDGAFYHFALRDGRHGAVTGQVWSPDGGSPPQVLVEIVQGLTKYCTSRDAALLPPLRAQAAALVHRLEKGD